jgi:molecular chaperone DnaJ
MDIKFDVYKLLDVSRNALEEDIIKQFRKISMQYHPDKNPNCEGLMKKLNIAKMTA